MTPCCRGRSGCPVRSSPSPTDWAVRYSAADETHQVELRLDLDLVACVTLHQDDRHVVHGLGDLPRFLAHVEQVQLAVLRNALIDPVPLEPVALDASPAGLVRVRALGHARYDPYGGQGLLDAPQYARVDHVSETLLVATLAADGRARGLATVGDASPSEGKQSQVHVLSQFLVHRKKLGDDEHAAPGAVALVD